VQGIDDENEYLLAFDDADFDRAGYVCYRHLSWKIPNTY
jgi:hypothetical protein